MIDDRRAVRRRRVVQAVRAVFVPSRRVGAALDEREERADVAGDGGGASGSGNKKKCALATFWFRAARKLLLRTRSRLTSVRWPCANGLKTVKTFKK